jgi:hypothetical protein
MTEERVVSDKSGNWIKSAIAHGSGLRDRSSVSFDHQRKMLRAIHEVGENISICREDGTLLVRFAYGGDIHYPYWAPVCTPSGAKVSIFSPHDHIWHRGLWMVWKYVNGINSGKVPSPESLSMARRSSSESMTSKSERAQWTCP